MDLIELIHQHYTSNPAQEFASQCAPEAAAEPAKLTVAALRALLKAKGLDIAGKKADLLQRIADAGEAGVAGIKAEQGEAVVAVKIEGAPGAPRPPSMPPPVTPGILGIAAVKSSGEDRIGAVELAVASAEVCECSGVPTTLALPLPLVTTCVCSRPPAWPPLLSTGCGAGEDPGWRELGRGARGSGDGGDRGAGEKPPGQASPEDAFRGARLARRCEFTVSHCQRERQ